MGKNALGAEDGRIELQVPLAIGTLQWGTTMIDNTLINARGCITEEEAQEIVKSCEESKVTLFDTAEGYGGGTSERRLGRLAGEAYKSSPLLMTKFLPVPWRYSHDCFERALRGSLKRMEIKCCPVYLLHSPVHWRPIEFWVESAAICKEKGLLLAMGLSNCNAEEVRRSVEAGKKFGVPVVCNQVHYSLLDYNSPALQEMEVTCRELGVTIIAYSPIGQGLLTDKLNSNNFGTNRISKMLRLGWDDIQPLRRSIRHIADLHGKETTMAQVALNWCIAHGTIPLVGCRSVAQCRDSLGALAWKLTDEEVKELDGLALGRSTLESPKWRRMLFVALAGCIMMICRTCDVFGYGIVKAAM